jgi:4-amino-4-deoxy-L-arabinose transferase-like glycosyltransferase
VIEITLPAFSFSRVYLLDRLKNAREDWLIVVLVTVVAAVPRLAALTSIPGGLHGDEAWTGIDAQRILHDGLIGPYVQSALGQPAGPLYFAAPFVGVFGNTVFAIRFAMALLAIATVPLAYGAFRVMFNRNVGAFAALLLAVSIWHLHYSRIAFMVISWPLVEMITLLFFFLGLRTQRWLYFALAGLALGCGVYTYNAYSVFIVAFVVLAAWVPMFGQQDLRQYLTRVCAVAAIAFVVALPLLLYIKGDNGYTEHYKTVSVLQTDEWKSASPLRRIDILSDNCRQFVNDAFWTGEPDFADGAGWQAMIDRVSLALLIVGLGMALWNWRRLPYAALLIMAAILPFGTIVTTQGTYRQTLGLVPFLAALEALPLAFVWGRAQTLEPRLRTTAYIAVGGVLAIITVLNMHTYFGKFPDTDVAQYTFGHEYTDAIEFIDTLPGDPFVYLYSNRWGLDYETRQYLAPHMRGEDRSKEFAKANDTTLQTDRKQDVVYMFLGLYIDQMDDVQRLYPDGQSFEKLSAPNQEEFRAYYLPALKPGETPPIPLPTFAPTPTVTPAVGGEDRDRERQAALEQIQQALEAYKTKHGAYPSNGGGVQTLCVYTSDDIGCKLKEELSPIPQDPLGDPGKNGYFYSSDGTTYAVYTIRETDALPECLDHPEHLTRLPSTLCVRGP